MKAIKKLLTLSLASLAIAALASCGGEKTSEPTSNVPERNEVDLSFDYYAKSKLRDDKKIFVLNDSNGKEKLSNDELFTAQAIQGLFARGEVTYYVDSRYVTNGTNIDMYYLEEAKKKHDLNIESTTLKDAITAYKEEWSTNIESGLWGTKIPLESFNTLEGIDAYVEEAKEGLSTPGYILYRRGEVSVNVAATLSAITGFLPVELDDKEKYEAMGLTMKFNVDNIALGYSWLFDVVKEELNPDGLVHQNYGSEGGVTNPFLKDYGIQNKYMYVYYDSLINAPSRFKTKLHSFLTPNRPIFGYCVSEDADVAFFSQFGQFIVPSDYTCNLSFFSAKELDSTDAYKQPNNDTDIKADPNKHYVAFVVSDGDNVTYWQNTQTFSPNYMAAAGRENDDFPVTWSISPSLADLMPTVLDNVYDNVATKNDYFCAPVSGHGYINAGNFAKENEGKNFDDYCNKLNTYMAKSGLNTVTVIGGNAQGDLNGVLHNYASCSNVKGGIVYEGQKYFGGVRGGVYWANGKPFVGPRDSLWETTPAYIAARLNMYECDPTSVDGYSIINVHPWSHTYEDIRTICNMLNDNVEVVSVDSIIKLMTDNIKDKSNSTAFDIPEKNGMSITEAKLQENPSLIPVNPLFNDFLLWEEDWSGNGLSFANEDEAMSNAGAIYKGSIQIEPDSIATKKEFVLPKQNNLWISFSARAKSVSSREIASFSLLATVDGVTKTIIDRADLKGVKGTGSEAVFGDGWQKFAIPLDQYFEGYEGKKCSITIKTEAGKPLKLDQFIIKQRVAESFTGDPYMNDFNNGSTDGWFLGEQYKTSQYYYWSSLDKNTGKPCGEIQMDISDGGGNEKRNGNTNLWCAKYYTLPNSNDISIEFDVHGGGDAGGMTKVSMYVDGHYIVLQDWQRHIENNTFTINLKQIAPSIDFAGKKATIVLEARDSGCNNGVGESVGLSYFYTTAK